MRTYEVIKSGDNWTSNGGGKSVKLLARLVHRIGVETVYLDNRDRYWTTLRNKTSSSMVQLNKEQAEKRVKIIKEIQNERKHSQKDTP